jgi:hypothetical protein
MFLMFWILLGGMAMLLNPFEICEFSRWDENRWLENVDCVELVWASVWSMCIVVEVWRWTVHRHNLTNLFVWDGNYIGYTNSEWEGCTWLRDHYLQSGYFGPKSSRFSL